MHDALCLIPGLNTTPAVFDSMIAALPPGIRVQAADCPALPNVDDIARSLLARLPEHFWLAGFSFGGYVALALLALAPQRVNGIALVCSSPAADTAAQAETRRQAILTARQGGHAQLVAAQTALAFHPDSLADSALMAQRQAMVAAYGAQRFMAHQQASLDRPDRHALLDGSRPTLVVAASHDRLFPPETLHRLAQGIPGAHFAAVAGAGHLLPLEQPERLAKLLAQWVEKAQPTELNQGTPYAHL